MSKTIYIGGRLESKEKGNVVTGANAILDDTKGKKQNVINKETDDELLRLEQSKQDNLNFDNAPTENSTNPVTSGGVYTAEKALSDAIEAILLLIPSAATELNKLVDTNTMNSSISTATATFRGTYNAVSDLGLTYQATHAQIEAALDALGLTADNNDFAFVQIPVSDESQDIAKTERFKFNGTNWLYEYDLNTSGFTAAQWAAINSGITVALVTKLTDLPTAAALQLALNGKQDTLTFDNEPTALSQNPVTSGGIYTAIQAVATALSDYSTTTDGRLNTLEGLIPTEASSSNKLTDKAYVDGLIQAITELIPSEATSANQLADKAYVLAQILAATPAFKGQFTTLAELQAVASPKAGDLGIVRTKDSDGMDVFTVYQYLNNAWNVFYSLSYHPQTKPATTGTTGDYPYNGMGRVELAKNMVNTGTELAPVMVNTLTQDMFYKGAVGSRVPNTNTIFVIRYDYVLAENITIPDNCVLEFEGGSISGAYTLTGANTGIKAGLVKIFDITITLAGSWNVAEAFSEWFGVNEDMAININKCLTAFRCCYLLEKEYITYSAITTTYNSVFRGRGKSVSKIIFYGADSHGILVGAACNMSDFSIYAYPNPTSGDFAGKSVLRIYNNLVDGGVTTRAWTFKNILVFVSPQNHTNQTIGVELYAPTMASGFTDCNLESVDVAYADIGYFINSAGGWINGNFIEGWASACKTNLKIDGTNGQVVDNKFIIHGQSGLDLEKLYDITGVVSYNNIEGYTFDMHDSPNAVIGTPTNLSDRHNSQKWLYTDKAVLLGTLLTKDVLDVIISGGNYSNKDLRGSGRFSFVEMGDVLYINAKKSPFFNINFYYKKVGDYMNIYASIPDYPGTYTIHINNNASFFISPTDKLEEFADVTAVVDNTKKTGGPNNFPSYPSVGDMNYHAFTGRLYVSNGVTWEDENGIPNGAIPLGTTAQRPDPSTVRLGAKYFDTDLCKWLFKVGGVTIDGTYYGNVWIDAMGNVV